MGKRLQRPLVKTVKETVDYVFSYLHPFPDGVVFSAKDLGFNEKRVLKILYARGIITREQVKGVSGKQFRYKWAAVMPPTNVLYGSIADEIRDIDSAKTKEQRKKRKEKKTMSTENNTNDTNTAKEIISELSDCEDLGPLFGITSQALWDELKARGYYIENNRLVTKLYLD